MADPLARRAPRTGVVDHYDEGRGLGVVAGDDGRRYDFHATALADGSRRVAAGTRVVFVVAAAHRGRLEARGLTAVGPPGSLTEPGRSATERPTVPATGARGRPRAAPQAQPAPG